MFVGSYLSWSLSELLAFIARGLPLSPRAAAWAAGQGWGRRYMEKSKKKATGWDERGRGELRKFFKFYALLATLFSLRLWLVR